MNFTTGKHGLQIPQQTKEKSDLIDFSPAAVEAWRSKLPMSNVGETAKRIYQLLSECHQVKLNSTERFRILEILHLPTQYVCQSLRKYYLGQSAMLSQKKRKIASLAQALQIETATGYNIIIEQLAQQKVQASKTFLPIAIQRSMSYFTHVLLRAYLLYAPEPKQVWNELHILYLLAEKLNIHKLDISDNEISMMCHNNISDVYKHALIIGITDPCRLQQCQIELIHIALEEWVSLVELNPFKSNNKDLFYVDLDNAKGPIYQDSDSVLASPNSRTLNIKSLLNRINKLNKEKLKSAKKYNLDDKPESQMTPCLLNHLVRTFTGVKHRDFKRMAETKILSISVGINSTNFFISELQNKSAHNDTEEENLYDDEIVYYEVGSKTQNTNNTKFELFECTTLDISKGGYCFKWSKEKSLPIFTGTIIGIKNICDDGNEQWQIGTIRWIQQQDGEVQFGVQILSYYAKAAKAQVFRDNQAIGQPSYILIAPEVEGNSHALTVITPPLPFKEADRVQIETDDEDFNCELTRKINQSASFNQFEFIKKENAQNKDVKEAITVTKPLEEQIQKTFNEVNTFGGL